MTHGSLFSGIGGFDLAAEWMGWENKFHCEWNTFGQKILKYYWPNSISYGDITATDFTIHRGQIDIITGGFPCQPFSLAGKRKGTEDSRHLWPEMLRAIRQISPRWVVGENVFGIINWDGGLVFEQVQADLEAEGYEVQPFILPACGVDAPHKRERVWFVAHSDSNGFNWCDGKYEVESGKGWIDALNDSEPYVMHSYGTMREGQHVIEKREGKLNRPNSGNGINNFQNFPTQPPICGGNDGLSDRLDGITFPKWRNESIKAYGNAIVPQVVYQIFKAIEQYENTCIS